MKIEDVIKALEGLENGNELIDALKSELSKKNNEASNLRKRAKTAEDAINAEKAKLLQVLQKLGIENGDAEDFDLEDALEALNINQGGKGKTKDDPEFAELQRQVAKLTKSITTLTKEKEASDKIVMEERDKRHSILKQQAVLAALTEGKAIKPATLVDLVAKFVKINDEDKLVFTNDVGDEVEVKDGVAGWLSANPEFVQNTGNGGAGSNGGPGGKQTEVDNAKAFAESRNKGTQAPASAGLNPWG